MYMILYIYIYYTHIPAYYSALKTEGTPVVCHHMSDIMLSQRSQALKNKYHMISLTRGILKS